MEGNANQKLLIAITIILLFILFSSPNNEPVYVQTYGEDDSYDSTMSYDTISLNENTIAIISNDLMDGTYGMLIVLEYDPETKTFEKVSERHLISDFNSEFQ